MTETVVLIVAAGQGSRMGGPPKQFLPLGGKPVIAHSHAALAAHPAIDAVVVVIGAGQQAELETALGPVSMVTGGATRRESVLNGLEALAADPPARVLIHDAARPFIPARVIDALLTALDSHDGAIPALAVADTLARSGGVLGETVSHGQTIACRCCTASSLSGRCKNPPKALQPQGYALPCVTLSMIGPSI